MIPVTQIVLPVLLLFWQWRFPAAGRRAYTLQVLSVAAVLSGLAFAGLWAMPPYWVPLAYSLGLLLTVAWQLGSGRGGADSDRSPGRVQKLMLALAGLLGMAGVYLTIMALLARVPPEVETVDIAPPFPAGTYLVAHGGSNTLLNNHLQTLAPDRPQFRPWRGQSRALDLFRIGPAGLHVDGWMPSDPTRYRTFGTPILAPCAGTVARVLDGVPDNPVPEMNRAQMAGNYVAVHCGGQHYVILAHFRNGSIRVQPGQLLAVGDRLGEMGNSGNSSEPHLHVHAQRGLPTDDPLGGEPLALTIAGHYPVRNDRLRVP